MAEKKNVNIEISIVRTMLRLTHPLHSRKSEEKRIPTTADHQVHFEFEAKKLEYYLLTLPAPTLI